MNKQYITKFLAKKVRTENSSIMITNHQVLIVNHARRGALEDFRPLTNLAHAFMVQDAIAKMKYTIKRKYAYELEELSCGNVRDWSGDDVGYDELFVFANATAEQRSIAAFRALATEEQIEESGL